MPRKTACWRGHPFSPANTRITRHKGYEHQVCRTCEKWRRENTIRRRPPSKREASDVAGPITLYRQERARKAARDAERWAAFVELSNRINAQLDLEARGGRPKGTRTLARITVGTALYGERS